MSTDRRLVEFLEAAPGLSVSEVKQAVSLIGQNLVFTSSTELTNAQLQELFRNFYQGLGFVLNFLFEDDGSDGTTGVLLQSDEIKAVIIISNYTSWAGPLKEVYITVKAFIVPPDDV